MSQASIAPQQKFTRVEELINLGVKFFHDNHLEPARLHFLAALSLDPKNSTAWQNLGAVLRNLNYFEAGHIASKRAVELTHGQNPYCLTNLGVSLLALRRHSEALKILSDIADRLSGDAPPRHNYGLILYIMGKYNDALAAFEKSLELRYQSNCASDRSITLLSMGKIEEGLAAYECRWETLNKSPIWKLPIREWKGEDVSGQRLIVHHEQGFGDSIMLVRFMKQLASQHKCHITLAVPQELVRLFAKSFPFISVLDYNDESLNDNSGFAYHVPMLSVLRYIGVRRPNDIDSSPYLMPVGGCPITVPKAHKRVGICWASGNHAPALMDRRRIVPLKFFLPLMEDPDINLISLQKGYDAKDIQSLGLENIIFDPSHRLNDFADTADVISQLDLVITVDSAVAHLAGALGRPTLVLSPYTRCWRWWGLPSGSPWYDRMALYTQAASGSWESTMKSLVGRASWILKEPKGHNKVYAVE